MRPFSTPMHESAGAWLSCDLVFVSFLHSSCPRISESDSRVFIMIIVHREGLDEFVPARDDPEELSAQYWREPSGEPSLGFGLPTQGSSVSQTDSFRGPSTRQVGRQAGVPYQALTYIHELIYR